MDEGGSTRCINPEGLAAYAEINNVFIIEDHPLPVFRDAERINRGKG
jgi:hypothetical protein